MLPGIRKLSIFLPRCPDLIESAISKTRPGRKILLENLQISYVWNLSKRNMLRPSTCDDRESRSCNISSRRQLF